MLVSFIIPVYNVERYLPTCLDSILSQGLEPEDFEIILVEDRSTDGSLSICREYCSNYKNITLIENEKNIGLGLARNKGMSNARGEYVHFVDSDDFLFQGSILDLLSLNIISSSPDIIRFESSKNENCSRALNKLTYEGKYNERRSLGPCLCVWRYWFKRQFLIENNIYSLDKKTGQDAIFTFTAFSKNPFIIVTSTIVYYYRLHNESITSKKDISFVNCLFEVIDEIKKISANSNLSTLYINEVYKDIIARFYRSRRSLQECVEFKKKMKAFDQYKIITEGPWYLQLSRIPLLLCLYLMLKK